MFTIDPPLADLEAGDDLTPELLAAAGAGSALVLCLEPGCGRRLLAVSYPQALRRAATHEKALHPGVFHARDQLRKATEVVDKPRAVPSRGARSKRGNQNGVSPRK